MATKSASKSTATPAPSSWFWSWAADYAPTAPGGSLNQWWTSGWGWNSSSGWSSSLPAGFTSQAQYTTYYNAQSASGQAKLNSAWYAKPTTAPTISPTNNKGSSIYPSSPFSSPVTNNNSNNNSNTNSNSSPFSASRQAIQDKANWKNTIQNKIDETIITPQQTITDNKFGNDTKWWTSDQFIERNKNIASDYVKRWLTTDAQIRAELEKNATFRTSSEANKLNTISDILSRVPLAQNNIQATTEWDTIAQNYQFKDLNDFLTKNTAVTAQVKSLLNDIAKYKQSGDIEAENMAKGTLWEIMAQWAKLGTADRTANAQTLAQLAQMSPEAKGVVDSYNLINTLMSKGVTYDQLPTYMGKDKTYIDQVMTGQRDKLWVKVNPEVAKELTATLDENKRNFEAENASAIAKQKLQLQRNEEDYQQAFQRQQAENNIQDENMSKLARVMGIGYSSSGVEGMNYVFQKWQEALSDLTKLHDRNDADIQSTIADISNTYLHNTNLYNLAYKDSMKNATQAFQTDILNIQNKYGQTSDAAREKIAGTTKTYLTDLTNLSKWRTEQQNEMNKQIRDRYKDTETLKLQKQQMELENYKNWYNQPNTTNGSATFMNNKITNIWWVNDVWVDRDVQMWENIQAPVSGKLTLAKDPKTGNVYAKITQSNGDTVQINHLDKSTLDYYKSINGTQIKAGQSIWVGGNSGNVKDINGNWLRKDWKDIDPTALASGKWSHVDVRVNSWGKQLYGQDLVNYLNNNWGWETTIDDIISFNDDVTRRKMKKDDVKRIWEAKKAVMSDPNATVEDILAWSNGGKSIWETQSKSLIKYDQAMDQLWAIATQIKDMKTWPILWSLREINPRDTNAQTLKAKLQWLVPTIARWVYGEVWVLTDNDVRLYAKTLPNLKWTADINKWVLAYTLDILAGWYKKQLTSLAGQWYDVSWLEWTYSNIKGQADLLRRELGIESSGNEIVTSWWDTQWVGSLLSTPWSAASKGTAR